jgi:DNA replication protein DnaC
MDDNIEQLLKNLKLSRITDVLERELQRATKTSCTYEELLARLLRHEYQCRQEQALEARIKRARLPERWSLETFPFKRQPGVSQRTIRQLAQLDFIQNATNIVFIGKTGVGKTGLASALLMKAMENGHRALFIKAQDLFDELYSSLADRSTRALINRMVNIDVLLVDELGYLNIRPEQSNMFFKLMEERYHRKPTLITTNLSYDEWFDFLGNKKMVEALLSRLRHYCHTVTIDGPSLRDPADMKEPS